MSKEAVNIKNRVLRANDVRKTIAKLQKEGYQVENETWFNKASNTPETWTTIRSKSSGRLVDFNWTAGRDEFDDKETHVWGISYKKERGDR